MSLAKKHGGGRGLKLGTVIPRAFFSQRREENHHLTLSKVSSGLNLSKAWVPYQEKDLLFTENRNLEGEVLRRLTGTPVFRWEGCFQQSMVRKEVLTSSAWFLPDVQLYLLYQPEVLLPTGPRQVRKTSGCLERRQASSHCPDRFNCALNSESTINPLWYLHPGWGKASVLFGTRWSKLQEEKRSQNYEAVWSPRFGELCLSPQLSPS